MPAIYTSLDPGDEVNGETLQGMIAAFRIPHLGRYLLEKHGLPAAPQPGQWYPVQAWLNVLAELEHDYGDRAVHEAGIRLADHAVWPPGLHTLHEALHALDASCRLNVRGPNIGYYRVVETGPRGLRIVCSTPNPIEFDCGVITGLARRFKPPGAEWVAVGKELPPADAAPALKWISVSW